jgi:hypothetical protein
VYAYGTTNLRFIGFFSDAITPVEALAAFAAAAFLFKNNVGSRGGGMTRPYGLYFLGMGCWFVAECIWSAYMLILGISVPFPSLADLFWLVGYAPILGALVSQAWPFRDVFPPRKGVALIVAMLAVTCIILLITIPPLFKEDLDSLSFLVSVGYPFLDAILLTVAIPILLLFRKGSYWRPMLFILLGLILQFVGDLAFAQGVLNGVYYAGSPTDMIFDWSYLALALGFYEAAKPALVEDGASP